MSDAPRVRPPEPAELAERAERAVAQRLPGARVSGVAALLGGTSSLTYSAQLASAGASRRIVIKVAPPGLPPVRNRDVLRQARVLEVLAHAPGVKVPDVYGTDAGAPPESPPLFVMAFVEGESYEPCLTSAEPSASGAQIQGRALAAARMLAALHAVDASDPRIAAEPVQDLPAELARWSRAFASVDEDLRADEALVREQLGKTMPAAGPLAVLHGDYRLGNMQCAGEEIGALIDWEIWSLGDPRLDLAWFLLNSDPRHPNCTRADTFMPSIDALRETYERAVGHPVAELGWFGALVRYKQSAASALLVKNGRKLAKPGVDLARMAENIPRLQRWALEVLG